MHLPCVDGALGSLGKLQLNAVNAVDTVNEQDQDEDKRDLHCVSRCFILRCCKLRTLIQYCNFAIAGLSEMKVRSLRFQVKGIGTMSDMKTTISKTRSTNTYREHSSQQTES